MAVWPPLLAVAGRGRATEAHRHHSLHAVVARAGTVQARVEGATRAAPGIITGPDVEHSIDAEGRDVVLLFADPESAPGASLVATLGGNDSACIDGDVRDALIADLPASPRSPELGAWAEAAVGILSGGAWQRPSMHPRVRRLLRELRDGPADTDTSLEALAARAGLSPSRLMHVFTESVGIPLRPYMKWLRLQRAATAIVAGMPLSAAAVEAGFSDAAHMTRTFKRMFGLTPSLLAQRSRP